MLTPNNKKQIRARRKMTLIEDDLKLKIELQEVKHQFAGLLDNFRSFDQVLQTPRVRQRQTTTERVDDARARVRALYAAKRARLQSSKPEVDKENCEFRHMTPISERGERKRPRIQGQCRPIFENEATRPDYDTSAWSDADSACVSGAESRKIDINDISQISGHRVLREHTSGSNIHSTFNYPLHSTLNYPLHSTIIEDEPDISPLADRTNSRHAHLDESMTRDEHIRIAGYAESCYNLRRQTAQVRLSDDVTRFRKQMAINESDLNFENTQLDLTTNATCHTILASSPTEDSDIIRGSMLEGDGFRGQDSRRWTPADRRHRPCHEKQRFVASSTQSIRLEQHSTPIFQTRAYRPSTTHPVHDQRLEYSATSSGHRHPVVRESPRRRRRSSRKSSSSGRRSSMRPSCLRPITSSILESSANASSVQDSMSSRREHDLRESVRRRLIDFNRRSSYSDVHVQTLAHF